MMMRSMPPASAHLALMPVPAPPPMIGLPAATWARKPVEAFVAGEEAHAPESDWRRRRRHRGRLAEQLGEQVEPPRSCSMPSVAMTSGRLPEDPLVLRVVGPAGVHAVRHQERLAEEVADDGQRDADADRVSEEPWPKTVA